MESLTINALAQGRKWRSKSRRMSSAGAVPHLQQGPGSLAVSSMQDGVYEGTGTGFRGKSLSVFVSRKARSW